MTFRRLLLPALTCAAACSSLGDAGAPVAIEVVTPNPAAIEFDDTLTLRARVLDQNGDSLGATIHWQTPDTHLVALDTVTGKVVGKVAGTARIQAVSGTLVSNLVGFTVRSTTDSVVVTTAAESLFVQTTDTASAALVPKVVDSTGAVVSGRTMTLTVVAPSPAVARLSGNDTIRTVLSDAGGLPTGPIRVRKSGVASGDSVIVRIDARRPSGAPVPGSGQKIRVFFQ